MSLGKILLSSIAVSISAGALAENSDRFSYNFGLESSGTSILNFFDDEESNGISPYIGLQYGSDTGLNFSIRGSANLWYDTLEDFPLEESDIGIATNSDIRAYRQDSFSLDRLRAEYNFKVGQSIFGRVTAGLLQTQYAGIDAEAIYAPSTSAFALGVQVGQVAKRDTSEVFGIIEDSEVTTGHVTAYWDTGYPGFLVSASYGKYLAEDMGATIKASKRFNNGWELTGELTATEYYFDSDDSSYLVPKLTLQIPLGIVLAGNNKRYAFDKFGISSDTDAGRRLQTTGDLYDDIRGYNSNGYEARWGSF